MKENFENKELSNVINKFSKENDGFIALAYEIANNYVEDIYDPEYLETFITELYSLISELYYAPERNDDEKETMLGVIGFLEKVTIHVGPFYDKEHQIEEENNYLSGYTTSPDLRKDCVENGRKIINGEKPLFAMGEYFDNENQIDESHYYSIIENGKESPFEISEIPSLKEFLEKRDGKTHSISEIEDVISNRTLNNINNAVSELSEDVQKKDDTKTLDEK